jgi:hypothetical protein
MSGPAGARAGEEQPVRATSVSRSRSGQKTTTGLTVAPDSESANAVLMSSSL